jgi:DNA repair protein RecN (Recombination protein N)
MLRSIHIRNYALIEEVQTTFSDGLTVLTGETGAGKSMLVTALGLALGGRAFTEQVRVGFDSAVVEAGFAMANDQVLSVRRELSRQGRNRCYLDGRGVSLKALREGVGPLVDMHGQHEHQTLMEQSKHLEFLDAFGGLVGELEQVKETYGKFSTTKRRLKAFLQNEEERRRRIELLKYQLDELNRAELVSGEDEMLSSEREFLRSAEKIALLADEACSLLDSEGEETILPAISRLKDALANLSELDGAVTDQSGATTEVYYQLEELSRFLANYRSALDFSPQRLEEVEGRLAQLSMLERKYNLANIEELLGYAQSITQELSDLANTVEDRQELEQRLVLERTALGKAAESLSRRRKERAENFNALVEKELSDLGMEGCAFLPYFGKWEDGDLVALSDGSEVSCRQSGIDNLEFLIAPNPGEEPLPLVRIVSGGELSRIMLALKSVLAEVDRVGTLIFDEIDVGLGGRAAAQVGKHLHELGAHRQVICISHLPQIACRADHHYVVEKGSQAGRTVTRVREAQGEERVLELARMLAGEAVPSEVTLKSARKMLAGK